MRKHTFYLDGVCAMDRGIYLQRPIEIDAAYPIYEREKIPGRNGENIEHTGAYSNRRGVANCFCATRDIAKAMDMATKFLTVGGVYRRLETSDDPEHFWQAAVVNSPAFYRRASALSTFDIEFDLKPQRFVKTGEMPIEMTAPGSIFNPYAQAALPLITVYALGSVDLLINGVMLELHYLQGELTIDFETQNAYNSNGFQNNMIRATRFPALVSGDNTIEWRGGNVEAIEIIPRWWEL